MWRRILVIVGTLSVVVTLGVAAFVTWCGHQTTARELRIFNVPPVDLGEETAHADPELGRRIVEIRNGCTDCHGKDLGGGIVINEPIFAVVSAPNITMTALSTWTDSEIARAIRNGVRPDGRSVRLMPSDEYANLSRSDLAAIVKYLRRVPPAPPRLTSVTFGLVGNVLSATGKLPRFFPAEIIDHAAPFLTKPAEAESVQFGAYLVNSACIGCHGRTLAGGPISGAPPEWPAASDLTPTGIGKWTDEQFLATMRTGITPAGQELRAPMPVAAMKQMSDLEIRSIWLYLKTLSKS